MMKPKRKVRAAWIAGYHFVTMVARSIILFRILIIWFTTKIGSKHLQYCIQPITFLSLQDVFAQLPVSQPVP